MRILYSWLMTTLAIMLASQILPHHFYVKSLGTAIGAALVLGILNATIKPILKFLSFPINILTLGLFSLVINGAMVSLMAKFMPGVRVSSFGSAILVAIILSIIHSLVQSNGRKR
ncbi:hypothetical protein ABB02_01920 [Clostridiaceae bacterium JG1575]|nr:hypothetical protein ABB02_01920 [Clostridiaceae bacterium JG1575]